MNRLYERTFNRIRMPEDKVRALRAELASGCSNSETEVIPMNTHKALRRPTTFLVAVILIASLTMSALAAGIYYNVVYHVVSDEEMAAMTENGALTELTGQNAIYEMDTYDYTEEDGQILVNFDHDKVGYRVLSDEEATALTGNGSTVDLAEQAADMEFSAYTYTEENGEIIASIGDEVGYHALSDEEAAALTGNGSTVDLTGQDADVEIDAYSCTEENGKVAVSIEH